MKKSSLILLFFALVFFLGIGGLASGLFLLFSPMNPQGSQQSFIVTKGDTVTSIARNLHEKGVLRSPIALRILYKFSSQSSAIQPGTYKVASSMTPKEILTTLLSDTQDAWVTLKEGWRSEEMAQELSGKLHSTFDSDAFIQLAKPVEGKLFPDTYLLSKDMTADGVFSKLTREFEEKYQKALETDGPGVLPKKETIVLASLIEREGRGERDSRVVAGILKNRLDLKMPLQVDATLQYAKGYDAVKQTWWAVPKAADKEALGPFNTYKNVGLPPSAICNPGLLSLQAALKPDKTAYLYYLHDLQGLAHYAVSYEEHLRNIETYLL